MAVPGREIERRQPDLAGNRRAAIAPAQPPGDHQVQDEEQLAVELEDDPLAHPPQADDRASFDGGDRRLQRAHEERIADPQPLERLVQHPRGERFEVERDVGQFRHASLLYRTDSREGKSGAGSWSWKLEAGS